MLSGSNQVEENTIRPYWASGRVIYDWRLVSTKTAIQLLIIYLLVNQQKHSNAFVEKLNKFSDLNENALNFLIMIGM